MTLSQKPSPQDGKTIDAAEKSDLLAFIAGRVEAGAKPRSTARQLSSFRRFFRYIMREGMRSTRTRRPKSRCRESAAHCRKP